MIRSDHWARGSQAIVVALLGLALATPAAATPPPTLQSGSVSPSTITGGDGAVQTITLSQPAPVGGVNIWLYSDWIYNSTTGANAFVPAGARSVRFPFRTAAPKTRTVRRLHAQVAGSDLVPIAEVTILPADPAPRAVTELRTSAEAALDGTTLEGTVILRNPAPAGGITVSLWSNTYYGPSVSVWPGHVTVPAGRDRATFPITVYSAQVPAVVTPSADLGTSIATHRLVVVPRTFAVHGGFADGGGVTDWAVGIGDAANLTGATVALRTDLPGVTVPDTVTIPAGSPGTSFPVTVSDSVPLGASGQVTATWNGRSVSSSFVIG